MNRKLLALIILAGCDPHASDDAQSDYDEGYAAGYQAAVEELDANYGALETRLAALEANDAVQDGRLDDHDSDIDSTISRLDSHDSDIDSMISRVDDLESRFIETDITLAVPADYEDINAALAALDGRVIGSSATVTIQVADGNYSYDTPIVVEHPNGDRIQIVGNAADPSAVSLTFTLGGFEVSHGHALGLLQGMRLIGSGTQSGVLVEDNAVASVMDVTTEFFSVGYSASYGGVLYADGTADTGSYYGYYAIGAAVLSATESTSDTPRYSGYDADSIGYVVANHSATTGAGRDCYIANNGTIDAQYAQADSCGASGFKSGGNINAAYASATNSIDYGFKAQFNGTMDADFATASTNGTGGYFAEFEGLISAVEASSSNNASIGYAAEYGGTIYAPSASSSGDTSAYFPSTSAILLDGAYIWY